MRGIVVGAVATFLAENGERVRGGADWVRTEAYTIEAVASVGDGQDTCIPESIGGRAVPIPPGRANRPNRPCRTANSDSMSGPMLRALLSVRTGQVPSTATPAPITAPRKVAQPVEATPSVSTSSCLKA